MDLKRITNNHLSPNLNLEGVYDEIRMRDEDGHPLTYIEYGNLIIYFKRASLRRHCVEADVRICVKPSIDSSCSSR